MHVRHLRSIFASMALPFGLSFLFATPVYAQRVDPQTKLIEQRNDIEQQLEQIAVIDRKVMVKMRDGKLMAADIYRPKNAGKVPIIFERTPYNFNYWDVKLGAPADMSRELEAVKRGYAYVVMQERGHFFSQGNYDILGTPLSDGSDEIKWMSTQPWASGKVGTTGCSSTAEWQLAVVAQNDPALATFNVQGFGAGVGRVGPYFEQGNWYRGGAVQLLFVSWIYDYGIQNQVRPMFPSNTTQAELVNASRDFDLATQMPPVDWNKAFWHLPLKDMIKAVGGPPGIFETRMPVSTGGNMVARTPNDPAWYKGGLWNDGLKISKPGLWFMSWFDVSVSPNLAAYNEVRRTAPKAVADQQYAVIAPVLHCAYTRATKDTMVGDLDMGDARFEYNKLVYGWFDHFLKGEDNGILQKQPKVMYYVMGKNQWEQSPTWPPAGATTQDFYFSSAGKANTLYGDGALTAKPDTDDHPDALVYDPANPVMTFGGGGCCQGTAVKFGSYDQRSEEARNDVLVYDSEPFKEGTEVSGPITVTLYVSSSAKDTDFTFKVMDVHPDGQAFNITENIQRMRYRDGYDKPLAWMSPGQIYKVTFQPIDTSNYFDAGHKLRIAISSSNFPRFDRNLNTGGNNYDEDKGVIAHNVVHHDAQHPSKITITVVPGGGKPMSVGMDKPD
ncbi:CocE/NonD family hydrolase [Rhodanobacter sp. L36]|uniref:CocE/NonD family hydrolase n=1 Tax=Rhodanobacter sp. L36 TaxID=1747221 RepID=UPI001C204487|nr:CocE/NonD family hydrolase [Rhodanobacter sp. L36]